MQRRAASKKRCCDYKAIAKVATPCFNRIFVNSHFQCPHLYRQTNDILKLLLLRYRHLCRHQYTRALSHRSQLQHWHHVRRILPHHALTHSFLGPRSSGLEAKRAAIFRVNQRRKCIARGTCAHASCPRRRILVLGAGLGARRFGEELIEEWVHAREAGDDEVESRLDNDPANNRIGRVRNQDTCIVRLEHPLAEAGAYKSAEGSISLEPGPRNLEVRTLQSRRKEWSTRLYGPWSYAASKWLARG